MKCAHGGTACTLYAYVAMMSSVNGNSMTSFPNMYSEAINITISTEGHELQGKVMEFSYVSRKIIVNVTIM